MLKFDIDPGGSASKQLHGAAGQLKDARPLFKVLAGVLETETEANFAAQGRPSWVPLSAATKAARLKRNKGSSLLKMLQDRGILAASISLSYGADFAQVGAGGAAKDYAAIQQLGGTIERPAYSVKTRLKTKPDGSLVRQGTEGRAKNLAVFAKDRNKRVQESWSTVEAFKINIPARPYLPFSGPPTAATLQPAAEKSILDALTRHLQESFR